LIDNGIEVDAVNNSGMTVLQLALIHLTMKGGVWNFYVQFQCIIYIIQRGADIYATCYGKSCSVIAYENNNLGSYAGDLWDAALAATGHDVQKFRAYHPHRARYDEPYTMDVFKYLWRGMEDECPYYAEAIRFYTDIKYKGGYLRHPTSIWKYNTELVRVGYESDSPDWDTEESGSLDWDTEESDSDGWETGSEFET
jgi:hypothetical protein